MVAGRTGAHEVCFSMGKVAEPVASARRVCGADSRSAGKDVLSGDCEAVGFTCSPIKTTWCRKGSAGFCAKPPNSTRSAAVPYLMKIRERAPRLVLRTACETLPAAIEEDIVLVRPVVIRPNSITLVYNRRLPMNLAAIQSALRERNIDAWLFYDHHHRDPIAYRVLGLPRI